jgi:hypothetical protein
MLYMHDGAPTHFSRAVRDVLSNISYDRWIGRGGPTACLTRSPYLDPLDFHLWEHVKTLVYATPVDNEDALHHRIVDARQTVPNCHGIFEQMRSSMMRRVETCIDSMEDILSTCYECTLSAIAHKLIFSGQCLDVGHYLFPNTHPRVVIFPLYLLLYNLHSGDSILNNIKISQWPMELLICDFIGQEEVHNFRAPPPQTVYSCSSLRVNLFINGSTALCWALDAFSVSRSSYTVGKTSWTGDKPVTRPLPTHRTAQTQNKRTQTSMPQARFEPTIPVFERAKTVRASDCDRPLIVTYV